MGFKGAQRGSSLDIFFLFLMSLDRRQETTSRDSFSESEEELPLAPRAPFQGEYSNQEPLNIDTTPTNTPDPYSSVNNSPINKGRTFTGCSLLSNYKEEKKIGEGTFGDVSLAVSKINGSKVALKKIIYHNVREGMPITALREIRILKRLKHPNIIRLQEIAVKPNMSGKSPCTFMVFPYMV
jgi:hypothetical protein